MIYYTIYKTTNLINNKIYIGKHQTKDIDDEYLGSGKILRNSIKKYGKENFKKEILFIFDNEEEMNLKEKELVNDEFLLNEDVYNICPGGQGGFGYINKNYLQPYAQNKELAKFGRTKCNQAMKEKYGVSHPSQIPGVLEKIKHKSKKTMIERYGVENYLELPINSEKARKAFKEKYGFDNPSQVPEIKEKIRLKRIENNFQKGPNNSQYGTKWIYNPNLKLNKKIKNSESIPTGWTKGRKLFE